MSRTHKKEYTEKALRDDKSCRNHGSDPWSRNDRTNQYRRVNMESVNDLNDHTWRQSWEESANDHQ